MVSPLPFHINVNFSFSKTSSPVGQRYCKERFKKLQYRGDNLSSLTFLLGQAPVLLLMNGGWDVLQTMWKSTA